MYLIQIIETTGLCFNEMNKLTMQYQNRLDALNSTKKETHNCWGFFRNRVESFHPRAPNAGYI